MRYKGILASSADPATLSKTIEGVIIGASSIIMFVGMNLFHVQIQAGDVVSLATSVGAVVGGIVAIYGLVKKLVNTFGRTA